MRKMLYLKPTHPNLIVRDPVSRRALPADGGEVPDTPFWQRRLKDKSVEPTKRPTSSKKKD